MDNIYRIQISLRPGVMEQPKCNDLENADAIMRKIFDINIGAKYP